MSSILVNRYGSRPVVIVGGLMVGLAMVTASFGTTILHLYLCVGVIGGTYFKDYHSNSQILRNKDIVDHNAYRHSI